MLRKFAPFFCAFILCIAAAAQASLPQETQRAIDELARQVLAKSGVPSASIAVVKDDQIAYVHAYGDAKIDPPTSAEPDMRYSIGSISKQFTATAILLLAEQGKLSLDDPVGKYVPRLTRGNEVTIREILSHTSGYQDYWPQDYVPPAMLKPTTASAILDRWARIPLDFEPGTRWQYSNTNYVIAGLIVEKVSGIPVFQFLSQHIFKPLGMTSVADIDKGKLPPADATGYFRYALGPLHPAPKEGEGWLFSMAELAMTAHDLARWDISMLKQEILKPESYREMETEVMLKDGEGSHYGLGLTVRPIAGHRAVSHGGEVSGFTATNVVLLDDGIAVAVLTNQDAVDASARIARGIVTALLAPATAQSSVPADPKEDALVRSVLMNFREGKIDRSLFTQNASDYFSEQALKDYQASLAPLGELESLTQTASALRGGMAEHTYRAQFANKTLNVSIYQMPDGKFEQFLLRARED